MLPRFSGGRTEGTRKDCRNTAILRGYSVLCFYRGPR